MVKHVVMALGLVVGVTNVAFGQAMDTPFQVRFASNLKKKDVIHVSNSGASSTVAIPQNGALCANVYAFSTAGPMIGCCACSVAANSLTSIPIVADVLGTPKPLPKQVILKLMGSKGGPSGCGPGTVGTGADVFVTGMLAWKGEDPFTPATLSAAELSSLSTQCSILHPTPSICASCQPQM